MPIQTPILNNFTAGELTPLLDGRVDFNKYSNGCLQLENFKVMPQGGVTRRGGTQYINEIKDHAKTSRLIPFEFSVTQAYILEFGENYIRIFKDLGRIESGGSPVEVTTTYTEAELPDIQFAQSADILYLVHKDHAPAKLSRTSHITWTLSDISFVHEGTGFDKNPIEIEVGSTIVLVHHLGHGVETGTSITLSGLKCEGLTDSEVNSTHSITKVDSNLYEITVTTAATDPSNTHYTYTPGDKTGGSNGRALYPFSWAVRNYPQTIAFFEQRLWFAGTPNKPQTLWASKSGDYENLSQGPLDDDALEYTIATEQVNAIRWLSPGKSLLVGTAGGEFLVSASASEEAISPSNVRIVRQSTYGSAFTRPIRIADIVLYLQRAKRKIRQLVYNFESDSMISPDLTLLAEHITQGNIKEMALQQEPFQNVWYVLGNGGLLSMTYLRDQEIVAWSKHYLGGLDVEVESATVIPSSTSCSCDEIWLIVKRTIDSSTKRYLEVITPGLRDSENLDDSFFVDSGLSYDGTPISSVSGLDHLEGETISVLVDGATHPSVVVTSGSITLNASYSKIHAGLPYTSKLKTMKIESGAVTGSTAQGATKRISNVVLRLFRSLGVKIGTSETKLDLIPFRSSANSMDSSVGLFTGDKEIPLRSGYETDGHIFVQQDQPLPLTILALIPRVKTNGK
jgi:hypothetical protein